MRTGVISVAAFAASFAAQAQTADLTRGTCAHLMDLPRGERAQLAVWLHGYYAGAAQRATLDRTKLEDALAAIERVCEANRAMPLIGSEARALFLDEQTPASPSDRQGLTPDLRRTAPAPSR